MKLVGLFDSPYVRRVAVSMRLQGLPFEHVALSVFRHINEMREFNPLIKVPMLILDNGDKLIDSSFILDYLDGIVAGDKRLTPAAGIERMKVQQHCAVALIAMEKAVQYYYETGLRPAENTYQAWAERVRTQMHDAFAMLEEMPESPAFNGEAITQAEVSTAVALAFARLVHPAEFPSGRYVKLERLSAHCEGLPAFLDTPME